ncbi:FAD-dependent oxidoreductase [Adlercreutzia sp. ZJ304]|uniref:FAD-dependent oxidoreductase n=1 Tax=Adlercreutzia sp. ZJ304 TaxID=2709791 RepID=UPI0013EA1A11|nr:FAD-dependent oxidoreductase [Adlercreutzia sp. ZJ304]
MEYVISIIGAGASGLAAAVAAVESARATGRHVRVVVYEATDKIGRPILASGNGRCNFSNASIDVRKYHSANFASAALEAFEQCVASLYGDRCSSASASSSSTLTHNGVVKFFEAHGLMWRCEDDGRLYPKANKASSVLDVLRRALETFDVQIRLGCVVESVEPPRKRGARFTMRLRGGALERADAVVLACGGGASNIVAHNIPYERPTPMLGPIATDTQYTKPLDNIRVRCSASLIRSGQIMHTERGELLFRKYGVSGIMMFNLSRLAQMGDNISIDFLPEIPKAEIHQFLCDRARELANTFGSVSWSNFLSGMLLPSVADVVLGRAGFRAEDKCSLALLDKLAEQLKSFTLEYRGIGDVKNCQVHRGGFLPEAIDACTMQVRDVRKLHITGEAIDVDGPCGGYNLHWAFASGILAGVSAVRS